VKNGTSYQRPLLRPQLKKDWQRLNEAGDGDADFGAGISGTQDSVKKKTKIKTSRSSHPPTDLFALMTVKMGRRFLIGIP
jgi:hypothetical protein